MNKIDSVLCPLHRSVGWSQGNFPFKPHSPVLVTALERCNLPSAKGGSPSGHRLEPEDCGAQENQAENGAFALFFC